MRLERCIRSLGDRTLPIPNRLDAARTHVSWILISHWPRCVKTCLLLLMVNHDVMWFDVSMHDSLGMTEIKCFEELEHVETNVKVRELGIQCLELGVLLDQPVAMDM